MRLTSVLSLMAAILAVMVISSGSGLYAEPPGERHPKIDCAALTGLTIPPVSIGLQTGGAKITSATLVPAAPQTIDSSGNVVLAMPEYCKVLGAIAPVDPNAFPINFEINLPTNWNHRSMQFGGGGLNGTVVTGLARPYPQPPNDPVPVARGYATFGSDSGHTGNDAAFGLNDEALRNFAYESLKKTKDTAVYVIGHYYGELPKYSYFVGNSNGGREGHTVVQRFPNDYDGVIAVVPILSHEPAHIHDNAVLTALAPLPMGGGGWMDTNKIKLISDSTAALCDANDGVVDGIVSKYGVLDPVLGWHAACQHDVSVLRCNIVNGVQADNENCLTDAQIAAVHVIRDRFTLPFTLPNGNNGYVGYGAMGGEINDWPTWVIGSQPPPVPQPGGVWDMSAYGVGTIPFFGHTDVRYFMARDPNFQTYKFNPLTYEPRINYVSAIMDSINPDISAFINKGGKLIMKENTADYARSTFLGINYYKSVLDKFGEKAVDQSIRLYVAVGANHLGAYAPSQADLISLLENWVEKGNAPPTNIVGVTMDPTNFKVKASRPMCGYGLYPKYNGSGNANDASSFTCAPLMGP